MDNVILPRIAPDAATISVGSDRYPATVIAHDTKTGILTLQGDTENVLAGSVMDGSAEYEYYRYTNGPLSYFRQRNGRFEEVQKNPKTGRWNIIGSSRRLYVGAREKYYDPSF